METDTDVLRKLTAEVSRLQAQREAVGAEAERAARMLEELNARKAALIPPESSGGERAAKELGGLEAALDAESATLSRIKAAAEESGRELNRLIVEVGVRLREEEKRLARRSYEALCEERYRLDGEAEEAVSGLLDVLDRLGDLHAEQVRAADDAGNSNLSRQDPRDAIENWLSRRLRHWLSAGSMPKYDAPLPELDPLALDPEREA